LIQLDLKKKIFNFLLRQWLMFCVCQKDGSLKQGVLRINANRRTDAYTTVEGFDEDVFIDGFRNQNRAFDGDTVAVLILPKDLWKRVEEKEDGEETHSSDDDEETLDETDEDVHIDEHGFDDEDKLAEEESKQFFAKVKLPQGSPLPISSPSTPTSSADSSAVTTPATPTTPSTTPGAQEGPKLRLDKGAAARMVQRSLGVYEQFRSVSPTTASANENKPTEAPKETLDVIIANSSTTKLESEASVEEITQVLSKLSVQEVLNANWPVLIFLI